MNNWCPQAGYGSDEESKARHPDGANEKDSEPEPRPSDGSWWLIADT